MDRTIRRSAARLRVRPEFDELLGIYARDEGKITLPQRIALQSLASFEEGARVTEELGGAPRTTRGSGARRVRTYPDAASRSPQGRFKFDQPSKAASPIATIVVPTTIVSPRWSTWGGSGRIPSRDAAQRRRTRDLPDGR